MGDIYTGVTKRARELSYAMLVRVFVARALLCLLDLFRKDSDS